MPPRQQFNEQNLRQLVKEGDLLKVNGKNQQNFTDNNDSTQQNGLQEQQNLKSTTNTTNTYFSQPIVWRNVILMSLLHIGALIGLKQCITSAQLKTTALGFFLYILGGLGITAGAHRLWSHRSYKAKWPVRIFLAILNTLAFQNSIYEWSRDHRTHHKYSETDADPHNVNRGFFFAHVGWLLVRKHPDVREKGKTIDMADLEADPIVMFQHKHYLKLVLLISFVIPTLLPMLLWNETFYNAFYICALLRYVVTLNNTWLVNSAAHMWGRRPYDKNNHSVENRYVSLGALGEGFHNFHHTFPWHYAASELGYDLNLTKGLIDTMAFFGQVYDRRVVTPEMIKARKMRTGDCPEKGPYGIHN